MPNHKAQEANHKGVEKMLNSLRDDALVFPLWTIGDIKAVIAKQREAARLKEIQLILKHHEGRMIGKEYLKDRLRYYKRKGESNGR